ncbi:MAG: DUF3800 domain-containing protein [Chloroflexi bacterium]|nr:DUF3800 domain-containing protein [Chloroflexota bacterium]
MMKSLLSSPSAATYQTSCSHEAYGDESSYNQGRYRSIAVVTVEARSSADFNQAIASLLCESGLGEFKWVNVRQARDRFAAQKILHFVIDQALNRALRVDVLLWDVEDARHKIKGRDDIANLQRMYHHLFKNALRRWSGDNTWTLCPDQNSALDWKRQQDYLDLADLPLGVDNQNRDLFRNRLRNEFRIHQVVEADSRKTPLCQVADLFAGLAVFSWSSFSAYCFWENQQHGQSRLPFDEQSSTLTKTQRERCPVLQYLDSECKAHKLGVSLREKQGLWTPNPVNPINFWHYEPQRIEDRAPTR